MSAWTKYQAEGNGYIPMERWGEDHWSTLAYLETRAVDARGVIRNTNMRTHARLHRHFVGLMFDGIQDGSMYPTRLNDGTELDKHDDWSCLEDMAAAGLLACESRVVRPQDMFGDSEARIKFTPLGLQVAAALRSHKAAGGNFDAFAYQPVTV